MKKYVAVLSVIAVLSSTLIADAGILFGRRSGRGSCANGSCSAGRSYVQVESIQPERVQVQVEDTKKEAATCCDCKCGCDLCECSEKSIEECEKNCTCDCGCPKCSCPRSVNDTATCTDGTCNANDSGSKNCASWSCNKSNQTQNYSYRSRSVNTTHVQYGRRTPIKNFVKKIFHR